MSTLENVIAHGNRPDPLTAPWDSRPDSWITCNDGTCLSVIAGFGTYSTPYWLASDADDRPFTHVEVMLGDEADPPDEWDEYEAGGIHAQVPVDLVREFVADHGGEA